MLRIKTLPSVIQRVLKEEEERKRSKTTASASTRTITKKKRTKGKTTVSSSTQTTAEEKEAKSESTVSTSTQTVTEEKETKGAVSISTQTITELESPKPVAVATTQKKKSRSKSVRIMTDEDAAGPSQPAEETEIEIITRSLSLGEVFEKGEKIIQILLKAGFAIKQSKVKRPAQEIQFLGVKWQDRRHQIPTKIINKITAMSPPTNKKETQAFLGAIGFWRMHIPEYSQTVSPLYLVTRKKNDFHWGPEQQQAFVQIKQEIAHAVALGPVRTGPDVKNVLYSADNSLSWSLWQKVPGETRGRPLGFWS
ncbi:hypothetical protein HGM15179_014224 [Zosterops borbonicus]|uniref:Reverse transcriptase/retrotransposon-derived protein RNase H-like domain-containing protein n=1 Tax=Zosterops borbonicus TaxID=364589 RepID=A0A8K1G7I2_9PASS|nr:hypothetical protein HGM15179_014224 [Zosterops borbonicus]